VELLPGEEFVPEGFSGLSKGKRRPGKHTNLLNPAALRIQNQSTLALDLKLMEVGQVKVLTVACSDSHALACTNTGAVFAWGENAHAQLGFRTPQNKAGVSFAPIPRKVEGLQ
jgi:alpha-tubulin suppressor-like RCC1 family protein